MGGPAAPTGRDRYRDYLSGLTDEALETECRNRINDYRRRRPGRERSRDEVSGPYALAWDECKRRGRTDLWENAMLNP